MDPQTTAGRYMRPLDEHALFTHGATSWRMDIATFRALEKVVKSASWHTPDVFPADTGLIVDRPLGRLTDQDRQEARSALSIMLNDPSLVPNLRMLGVLEVGEVELQNGALDHGWHHDGLAGKRHGHAGDFFCITYFSERTWDDDWGGHFEYGVRSLGDHWPTSSFQPEGQVMRIAPAARTTLLGWNQNPCLVHRSAPLRELRDRITMIASVRLRPRK